MRGVGMALGWLVAFGLFFGAIPFAILIGFLALLWRAARWADAQEQARKSRPPFDY